MVVHDFYLRWTLAGPPETDPVSLVDPDAVPTSPLAHQRFESIPRGNPKFFEAFHGIELIQLPAGYGPKLTRTALAGRFRVPAVKHVLRTLAREGPYHGDTIAR